MLSFSNFLKLNIKSVLSANVRCIQTTSIDSAARKGTREKAKKKKVKVEVQKIGFIPHNQRNKDKLNLLRANKHVDDSWKAVPTDNCWVGRYYRWRVYSVQEAIQCHRETHHPTMYNVPNAPLNVHIELNMQGEKVTRFIDNFQRMATIPHKFELNENRNIIVFAKGQENLKAATDAGAALVGGMDLIKDIQNGDLQLSEYPFVVAHPNILPDLVVVRGLMKKKFPNPKNGTLGVNLAEIIGKYLNGIQYYATKDENQKDFGLITTCIGHLNMDANHLEKNLEALLKDINTVRPKRSGRFITRVLLKSPPSGEKLKIDPFLYIPEENKGKTGDVVEEEEADAENEEKIEATN